MQNCPQHHRKHDPNTDAPNMDALDDADYDSTDSLDAIDNDASYPKLVHLSLNNRNHIIAPNTKKQKKNMTPNTDAPGADSPDAADYDAAYPYSLCNHKN